MPVELNAAVEREAVGFNEAAGITPRMPSAASASLNAVVSLQ